MRQLFGFGEGLHPPSWLSAGEPPDWGSGNRVLDGKPDHSLKRLALLDAGVGAAAAVAAVA